VRPALKRRISLANKAGDDILRCQADITQVILNPVESIHRSYRVVGVVGPILHLIGRKVNVLRHIEQIDVCGILHIEEALLPLMTHKYRECIVVLSINKSVEPNEEQKVLMSGFDQGFTINTSKRIFRGI
jgi:hypothetical protein